MRNFLHTHRPFRATVFNAHRQPVLTVPFIPMLFVLRCYVFARLLFILVILSAFC